MDPLVLTLLLDDVAQAAFDQQRRRWFPAGRTAVGAHVTLFHAVPGELGEQVLADVTEVCRRPPFAVRVDEVVPLGRGAAYRLRAPELEAVHRTLQRRWWDSLTPQDRGGFRAHVTVQNKVAPDVARQTVATLRAGFAPRDVQALGVAMWRYVGGPWEPVAQVRFAPDATSGG